MTGPGKFIFLNDAGDLAECGWDNPARGKLWRYNLHYFDDMNARNAETRSSWHAALIDDWIARNPTAQGTGWEPYPTSLRIVNWIKHALSGGVLADVALHSLAVQTRWLERRIEWRLMGNHLFANAKALVFAGLFFDGEEARRWRGKGFRILASEIPEQIHSDGGHFELSPMYHALALEDMLDLLNVTRCFASALDERARQCAADIEHRLPAMFAWLQAMSHPDGGIAFFNDCAFGIAPVNDEIEAYAIRLGEPLAAVSREIVHLRDTGYVRLCAGPAALIADMAAVGPDYLPGHAHADTLSFELSLFGARVLVNSGVSRYGDCAERLRQRGTAVHNTIVVDGENSSEVWSGFRVARRAYPLDVRVGRDGERIYAQAAHNGYARLRGKPIHQRRWTLSPDMLSVEDHVTSSVSMAEARYHLHPSVTCELAGANEARLTFSGRSIRLRSEGGALRCEPSKWHPEFGVDIPSICIVLPLVDGKSRLDLHWN
ncbi:MAG: heparinase II/III family protein [Beijerinckiaceae bacterium]|nr:heparinase II/III family protein [Beijerinckiaceae bacterium]